MSKTGFRGVDEKGVFQSGEKDYKIKQVYRGFLLSRLIAEKIGSLNSIDGKH